MVYLKKGSKFQAQACASMAWAFAKTELESSDQFFDAVSGRCWDDAGP